MTRAHFNTQTIAPVCGASSVTIPAMRRLLVLFAAGALAASSQTVTGTLECRVTDSSGGFIMGTAIKAVNRETGLERATKTNHEGYAQLTFLPLGEYTLSAAATGFGAQSRIVEVALNT